MAVFKSSAQSQSLNLFLNASFFVLLITFVFFTTLSSHSFTPLNFKPPKAAFTRQSLGLHASDSCTELLNYRTSADKCAYVKSHSGCESQGYISYLQLLYCSSSHQVLGYTILILWLIILFYLLGNTAADYFCSSLEGMSSVLKLSPAVAGVTLLSLGNGAPDLFSSIVSFMGDAEADLVGLNSILGGVFFVSSVVVGIISISVSHHHVSVDEFNFRRDVLFLLLSLACLFIVVVLGKINLWGAFGFLSLYLIYVVLISSSQLCCNNQGDKGCTRSTDEAGGWDRCLEAPLLGGPAVSDVEDVVVSADQNKNGQVTDQAQDGRSSRQRLIKCLLYILKLPLYLPRRLTIPVVSEEDWSKPFAVLSVTLCPLLLAFLSDSCFPKSWSLPIYAAGGSLGALFGVLALVATKSSHPPRRWLLPWLAGGFLMSVAWTYILARELVSLLVSLGLICGVSPSVLGLTVLAWGNSLGDLVANLSMAANGGAEGTQVAFSGCYAGPLFNVVMGLGVSLVYSAWAVYPNCYVLPTDPYVGETMGFLAGGLLFTLVVLSRNKMVLDRYLGGGLLAIYLCFLSLRIARVCGLVSKLSYPPPLQT